jgi:glycerol-3-phosphate acyltransferase PlsX
MKDMIREEIQANPLTTIGGLLAKPAFSRVSKRLDPDEVGGAPLLGVNGVVIVGHGRTNAYAMKQAITQARLAFQRDIVGAIRDGLGV